VFTLRPMAQTTLVSNKISSWCEERVAKLNGEWSVLIGSFQVKVDDNKQWVQRHKKQKFDTH
jgi:cell division septation protein DedD